MVVKQPLALPGFANNMFFGRTVAIRFGPQRSTLKYITNKFRLVFKIISLSLYNKSIATPIQNWIWIELSFCPAACALVGGCGDDNIWATLHNTLLHTDRASGCNIFFCLSCQIQNLADKTEVFNLLPSTKGISQQLQCNQRPAKTLWTVAKTSLFFWNQSWLIRLV